MTREPAPLTGLAIGDALGMPFETHSFTSEALQSWTDRRFRSGETNELLRNFSPGQWTDDTKMALALANSLVDHLTYNPLAALENYMEWYFSGDHRGMGKATREALERHIKGYHWNQMGVLHAEGNGSAMRVAPIGFFFRKSLLTVRDMARIDANITHRSDVAEEGSIAVAMAVALLSEGIVGKRELIRPLHNWLYQNRVAAGLSQVEEFLKTDPGPSSVLEKLLEMGTGAHVIQTVPAAFLCFMATDSFAEAVELAIQAGGDTDTTAAVTGALAGAYYGDDQLKPYLDELEDGEFIRHVDHILWLSAPNIPPDL